MIITTKDEISVVLNLNIKDKLGSKEYNQKIWKIIEKMDRSFLPLDLVWENIKWGESVRVPECDGSLWWGCQ